MKNQQFHTLLRRLELDGQPMTVTRLAEELASSPSHLSQVLNNRQEGKGQLGKRGGKTRLRVAKFFARQWPNEAARLFAALGWDAQGNVLTTTQVPRETNYHVETIP